MSSESPLAIITGAASGLGAACARVLAADGYAVCLLDRDAPGLAAIETELLRDGREVSKAVVDLLDSQSVTAAIREHPARARLRALVNVAGLVSFGTVTDIDLEEWDRVIGVKLRGDFITCRAAIPVMAGNGGGAIVNISSMSGRTRSVVTSPGYVASNAGVIGLTMTLAAQHAKQNIRVNCVAPGMIDTPMAQKFDPAHLEAIRSAIPLGRLAAASEIAAVVAFLVSDKASYITGETINANGGMFMQ